MREALQLREAPTPNTLVLIRFGRTTLADEKLRQDGLDGIRRRATTAGLSKPKRKKADACV